jgi:antitoxin (DNA-binding transcriptional repressor) of toxin-antitoxin stability system
MPTRTRIYRVGVFEAKTRLSELLRKVEAGAVIVIERRGAVVAEIRLPADRAPEDADRLIAEVRSLRQRVAASGGRLLESRDAIADLVAEGRRI